MKILKDNFSIINTNNNPCCNTYPRKMVCEKCRSELEYDTSDMEMGVLGCIHVKCPLCGEYNMLDDNENNIVLTADNVEFPIHFFHTSKETGAVDICNNNEIKKCINSAIAFFRNNKDEFAWYCCSGNLMVFVLRFAGDEEYEVFVSNDYFDTYIPFEKADY